MFYDRDNINCFFSEMTDIFIFALKNGLAYIGEIPLNIENKHVMSAVKFGLDCVENGMNPMTIRMLLETSNLLTFKENDDAKDVLLELKLLELIIPYIQMSEKQKFLDLLCQLCSVKVKSILEMRLSGE